MNLNEVKTEQKDNAAKDGGCGLFHRFWGWRRRVGFDPANPNHVFLSTAVISPYFRNCQRHHLQVIVERTGGLGSM
jgi:hypothetical protein